MTFKVNPQSWSKKTLCRKLKKQSSHRYKRTLEEITADAIWKRTTRIQTWGKWIKAEVTSWAISWRLTENYCFRGIIKVTVTWEKASRRFV